MCRLLLMARDADKMTLARYRAHLRDVLIPEAQAIRARRDPSMFDRNQAMRIIERRQRYEKWQPLVDRGDVAHRLTPEQMARLVEFLTAYEQNPVTDVQLKAAELIAFYPEHRKWADRIVLEEAVKTDEELTTWCQRQADARLDRGDLVSVNPDSWNSQEHTSGLFVQIYLPGVAETAYRRYLAAGTTRPRKWRLVYADLPAAIRNNLQNNGIAQGNANSLLGAWLDRETGARE